jgi:purine-binding chemotaxis protein CheW
VRRVSSSRSRSDHAKNLVGFVVGGARYAVEVAAVREIVNPHTFRLVANAPDGVLGLADHRGEVVTLLDLRRLFGLPPAVATRRTKWVVLHVGARVVGLVVDAVTEVFGFGPDARREVPSLGDASRGVAAVHAHEGELVFVLDVARLVTGLALDTAPRSAGARPALPGDVAGR